MDAFDKYQQILSNLQKDKAKMEQEANQDPISFLEEIGFERNLHNLT